MWIWVVCICIAKIKLLKYNSYGCNTSIAQYSVRRLVNLSRCYYLCLMSTNCLSTNCLREHAPRSRLRLRPHPRVVYPVFCSNADGSQQVDALTRTEPGGWPRRSGKVRQMRGNVYLRCLSRFAEEFGRCMAPLSCHSPTLPTRANSWAN